MLAQGSYLTKERELCCAVLAGSSKRPFSKAAASEEARRYVPHFVWAVRPLNESWRTEKPLQ
jgi:hypothetical protein